MNNIQEIMAKLEKLGSQKNLEGMARFGINTEKAFGVPNAELRKIAKVIRREIKDPNARHQLALQLWNQGYHEAMILAALIDVVEMISEDQMDAWVSDFKSWAVCDTVLGHLLDKVPFVYDKIEQYTKDDREFVKRAGFALIAWRAVHDKQQPDSTFVRLLNNIKREASDDRNFVRKAVNWALRQIGKRNEYLRQEALRVAGEILELDSKSARWIASGAIRELSRIK